MLRKMIMQDSTSWKAIRFLESLQQTIWGFLFSVPFDSQGFPDAFMYMTPRMRADLWHGSRYGWERKENGSLGENLRKGTEPIISEPTKTRQLYLRES
jgi:hypothetical protein